MDKDMEQQADHESEAPIPPKPNFGTAQIGNQKVPKPGTDDVSDRNELDDVAE